MKASSRSSTIRRRPVSQSRALRLPSQAPADYELDVGPAVPRQSVHHRLADQRHRHLPVGPAPFDRRRRLQRIPVRVNRPAAEHGARSDARGSRDEGLGHDPVSTSYLNSKRFVLPERSSATSDEIPCSGPDQRRVDVSISKRDPADRANFARIPRRGLQRLEHAGVPQSQAGHVQRIVRRDHPNPRRSARHSIRPQAEVLTSQDLALENPSREIRRVRESESCEEHAMKRWAVLLLLWALPVLGAEPLAKVGHLHW